MEFVRTGLGQAVWASLLLAVILLIATNAGRKLLSVSGWRMPEEPRIMGFFSVATGLIVLTLGVLILGLAGILNSASLGLWLAALAVFSFPFHFPEINFPRKKAALFLVLGLAIVFFLAWAQCLVPPIENDALAYHLAYARDYIFSGKISYLPYSYASLWPSQGGMFFTLGLALQGCSLAKLFHWAFYVLTTAAVYVFGRRFLKPLAAGLAAAVFVFTPAAFAQSSQAYVDLILAFFVFISFQAFLMDAQIGEKRAAWWSGVFMGGALATKYLGLGFAGILLIFWGLKARSKAKACILFILGAFLTAGIWYLRSWFLIGNPVYPFFSSLFGRGYETYLRDGMGRDPISFLKLLWDVTLHPAPFGGELLGPLYLMFLPFLLFKIPQASREAKWTAAFVVLIALFLFTQTQQVRYFLVLTPFMALGVGVALQSLWENGLWARRVAAALVGFVILIHSGIFVYRTRDSWPVVLGKQSAESYLRTHERSFLGYAFLKQFMAPGERVFIAGEPRYFYNQGVQAVISMPELRQALERSGVSFNTYLTREQFDYIWIDENSIEEPISRHLAQFYEPAFAYQFTEKPQTYSFGLYRRKSTKF